MFPEFSLSENINYTPNKFSLNNQNNLYLCSVNIKLFDM